MNRIARVLLGSLLLLSACSTSGGTRNPPGVPVADAVLVYEGARYQSFRADTPNAANIHLLDVHHDSRGWIVTIATVFLSVPTYHSSGAACSNCAGGYTRNPIGGSAGGSVQFPILQSTDGRTFTPWQLSGEGPSSGLIGIHRGRGGTIAVSRWVHRTAITEGTFYALTRIDPETARFVADPALANNRLMGNPYAHGSMLSGIRTDEALGTISGTQFDGTLTHWENNTSLYREFRRLTDQYEWIGTDQELFYTFVRSVDDRENCLMQLRYSSADHIPTRFCAPRLSWPSVLEEAGRARVHRASFGPIVIGARDGRGMAAAMDATSQTVRSWELGPANDSSTYALPTIHARYGPFFPLGGTDGNVRFIDIQEDGRAVQAIFAPTPCTDHAACPGSRIEWIEPVGNGEYDVFYIVEPDPTAAIHEYIYKLRQRPQLIDADRYVPMSADGGTSGVDASVNSPIPAFPNAFPAGSLERACLAYAYCHPETSATQCLTDWSGIPSTAPSFQRFVSAATMGCSAVLDAWRAPLEMNSMCARAECHGDVLVARCSSGRAILTLDCAAHGTQCRELGGRPQCTDGSPSTDCNTCTANGNALFCGVGSAGLPFTLNCRSAGLECVMNGGSPQCLPPVSNCTDAPSHCNGNRIEWCMEGRSYARDCSPEGRTCTTDQHTQPACDNPSFERSCLGSGIPTQCAGPYLVFCTGAEHFAEAHYLDCRTIGATTCTGGRCV